MNIYRFKFKKCLRNLNWLFWLIEQLSIPTAFTLYATQVWTGCSCSKRITGHCPKAVYLAPLILRFPEGGYMFMVTSGSKLLVLCVLILHHYLFFVCSFGSVYLSPCCETQVSLICVKKKKKKISCKAFPCIADLTGVGVKESRVRFYILGIIRISNWKSDVFVLKSPKVTLLLGIWVLTPNSAPATHRFV